MAADRPTAEPGKRRNRFSAAGACTCGAVQYELTKPPLFTHACHCLDCQRESGSAFNHHIMIESTAITIRTGETQSVSVPSASGRAHYIVRCSHCKTPLWSRHGSLTSKICYVKVGTLDDPLAFPPLAHIYVRSAHPWLKLDAAVPAFERSYSSAKLWPAESLRRYAALTSGSKIAAPRGRNADGSDNGSDGNQASAFTVQTLQK
jgi:hypothetical protein